jgi:hypothetical protein
MLYEPGQVLGKEVNLVAEWGLRAAAQSARKNVLPTLVGLQPEHRINLMDIREDLLLRTAHHSRFFVT